MNNQALRLVLQAFVLVLCVFITPARAQSVDQGTAYSQCMAEYAEYHAAWPNQVGGCSAGNNNGLTGYYCRTSGTGAPPFSPCPRPWFYYSEAQTCSTRPEEFTWSPVQGNQVCSQGCMYKYWIGIGTASSYAPTGGVCTEADAPKPRPDTDGDGVPDDEDAFPNDPNESADSDGDGVGDNADFSPEDPTDGLDDGEGNESDNTASGGGDCNTPPSCKGDGIACNTNYQIWKLRCTSATVTGSPDTCNTAYTCNGDSAQCAQIALLRKTACSNVISGNVDTDGDGFGVGDSSNLKAIKDALTSEGEGVGSVSVPWGQGGVEDVSWSSGLGGGTCPAPIATSVTVAGYTANIEFSFDPLCRFALLFQAVTIAMATVMAGFIIAGVRK